MHAMCPSLRSVPKTRAVSSSVNAVMLWIHLVSRGPACLFLTFSQDNGDVTYWIGLYTNYE